MIVESRHRTKLDAKLDTELFGCVVVGGTVCGAGVVVDAKRTPRFVGQFGSFVELNGPILDINMKI